jgi:hypothetical protein
MDLIAMIEIICQKVSMPSSKNLMVHVCTLDVITAIPGHYAKLDMAVGSVSITSGKVFSLAFHSSVQVESPYHLGTWDVILTMPLVT